MPPPTILVSLLPPQSLSRSIPKQGRLIPSLSLFKQQHASLHSSPKSPPNPPLENLRSSSLILSFFSSFSCFKFHLSLPAHRSSGQVQDGATTASTTSLTLLSKLMILHLPSILTSSCFKLNSVLISKICFLIGFLCDVYWD